MRSVLARRRLALSVAALCLFPPIAGGAEPGNPIADLTATTVAGRSLEFTPFFAAHRATVVLFLSASCPYSNFYNRKIRDLAAAYASRGVGFIGVYPDASDSAEDVRQHAARNGHAFPLLQDPGLGLTRAFGAVRTPEAFVVDQARRVRYRGRLESKIGSPDLVRALDAVLAGRPVKEPQTKAFGCSIEGLP